VLAQHSAWSMKSFTALNMHGARVDFSVNDLFVLSQTTHGKYGASRLKSQGSGNSFTQKEMTIKDVGALRLNHFHIETKRFCLKHGLSAWIDNHGVRIWPILTPILCYGATHHSL